MGDGVIESCTLSGGNFQTNLTNPETSVRSLTLDLPARRVYYASVDEQESALHSMDYSGSDTKEHFRLRQLSSVYGLGVLRGYVYWMNYARGVDIIYHQLLNATNATSAEQANVLKRVGKVSSIFL